MPQLLDKHWSEFTVWSFSPFMDFWVYNKVNVGTFSTVSSCFSHMYSVISGNNFVHTAALVPSVNHKTKSLGSEASSSYGVIHCTQRQELDIFHCMHAQNLTQVQLSVHSDLIVNNILVTVWSLRDAMIVNGVS